MTGAALRPALLLLVGASLLPVAADLPSPDRAAAVPGRPDAPVRPAAATVRADTTRPPFVPPPVSRLRARRAALLDSLGPGAAVVPSARLRDLEASYPQASDFRQANDFLYLTGLRTPDSWLVLLSRPGGARKAVLFVPEADPTRARWTGDLPSRSEITARSGIDDVRPTAEFERMVREGSLGRLAGSGKLYLPLDRRGGERELIRALAFGPADAADLGPALAGLRLVKDGHELRVLREAVAITGAGIRRAMRRARPGDWEHEIEAEIEYAVRRRGAARLGFPSIVASGPKATVLHYDDARRRTGAGDLVLLDVGAEYSHYTADVSRTFPVDGRFTARQRELYDLVLGALRAGVDAVRPGATMRDVDRAVRRHLREHSGGLCGEETCDRRMGHGAGHWLGMDVHDVGPYGATFRPGMVLTVEPGVYLPEEGIGIRVEEDVLVTEEGREVLTAGIPRLPGEIESLMAEGMR